MFNYTSVGTGDDDQSRSDAVCAVQLTISLLFVCCAFMELLTSIRRLEDVIEEPVGHLD